VSTEGAAWDKTKAAVQSVKNAVFNPLQTLTSSIIQSALNKILKDYKNSDPSYDYKKELNAIVDHANRAIKKFNQSKDEAELVNELKAIDNEGQQLCNNITKKYNLDKETNDAVHVMIATKVMINFASIFKKHPEIMNHFQ
jgi:ABC-type microcin C transport system permease subunit YejB